jgi:hypothetical protein
VDLGTSELLGPRQASTISAHEICDTAMAGKVVSLIGQRMVYVRQYFDFKRGPEAILYEPMDCGDISFTAKGIALTRDVRVESIEEDDDYNLSFICEEFNGNTGSASTASSTGPTGAVPNTQVAAGAVNQPVIFEPNSSAALFITGSAAACVICAVSGGPSGVYDPNFGGAVVNVSTDGSTYVPIGTIEQPARMGVLSASLASYGGSNPDAGHTLSVNLSESAGTLASASSGTDAAAGSTLCVIQDGPGGAIELVGPQTATLTGPSAYNLTNLYRGLFATTAGAHSSGALFARLDNSIFIYQLPAAYIGRTLYFKFQSFNIWGNAPQDLSTCTAYTYTPAGTGYGGGSGGVPNAPTSVTATPVAGGGVIAWAANPATDNVAIYKVYRANGTGASFGSASLIGTSGGTTYPDATVSAASYTYFVVAENAVGDSSPSAGANLVGTTSGGLWGFAFERDLTAVVVGQSVADFISEVAWTLPTSLPLCAVKLSDDGVGPLIQTDFDLQVNGVSAGTVRFAISATTATLIKATSTAVPANQKVQIFPPASLNGMTGRLYGSFVGPR